MIFPGFLNANLGKYGQLPAIDLCSNEVPCVQNDPSKLGDMLFYKNI